MRRCFGAASGNLPRWIVVSGRKFHGFKRSFDEAAFRGISEATQADSVIGREQTKRLFGLPYPLATFVVDMQCYYRHFPDSRRSDDQILVPCEMVQPRMDTWVENRNFP